MVIKDEIDYLEYDFGQLIIRASQSKGVWMGLMTRSPIKDPYGYIEKLVAQGFMSRTKYHHLWQYALTARGIETIVSRQQERKRVEAQRLASETAHNSRE
jgi:ABC-type uncharacterized transport system involved in gliding motility auxiliary subunit